MLLFLLVRADPGGGGFRSKTSIKGQLEHLGETLGLLECGGQGRNRGHYTLPFMPLDGIRLNPRLGFQ